MAFSVELQSPLTHCKTGPGVILVLPSEPTSRLPAVGFFLDPLPRQKWAEEGFCVASVTLSPHEGPQLRAGLENALQQLSAMPTLSRKDKVGLIVYDTVLLEEALSTLSDLSQLGAIAGYTKSAITLGEDASGKALFHLARAAQSAQDTSSASYDVADEYFTIPGQPSYDKAAATLAHQRTLVFMRKFLDGPYFDLEKIWEEHTLYEFGERAVEKTMATMVEQPYVNHVPTLTGGIGRPALTDFYANHFIFSNPDSITLKLVSRTIGPDRVVDEMIIEFIHDRVVDWMLPGIPPTGKQVSIPLVGVVNVRGDKLYHEHIYWDQASVLVQIGLLPAQLAFPLNFGGGLGGKMFTLPVAGVEQARKMIDAVGVPSNELIP